MSTLHADERSGNAPDAAAIDEMFASIGDRPATPPKPAPEPPIVPTAHRPVPRKHHEHRDYESQFDWVGWLLRAAVVACFAMAFYPLLNRSSESPVRANAATTDVSASPEMRVVTRNIQDFDVGMRAAGENPDRSQVETAPEPDPESSRKLVLRMKKESGRNLFIKLIRPDHWIEELEIAEGGTFFLDLPEMGAVGDAHVEEILPCPEIQQGPGNVVTGVFAHEADPDQKILRVEFANGAVIKGVTDNHPFWAVDRSEFVPVGDLREGERVQVRDGTTTVTRIETRYARAGEMLYNLETHNEHVYQVTTAGILVHNSCADRAVAAARRHGGVEIRPSHYQFPNRTAARRAASEIAGNLGPNPSTIRLGADLRDVPGRLKNSTRVIGRETIDKTAGWRDDFLGHERLNAGPHVNAWAEGLEFHLWY